MTELRWDGLCVNTRVFYPLLLLCLLPPKKAVSLWFLSFIKENPKEEKERSNEQELQKRTTQNTRVFGKVLLMLFMKQTSSSFVVLTPDAMILCFVRRLFCHFIDFMSLVLLSRDWSFKPPLVFFFCECPVFFDLLLITTSLKSLSHL